MRRLVLLGCLLVALAGCTSGAGDPVEPLAGSGGTFDEDCPEGATGVSEWDLLKGYVFPGYVNPDAGAGESHRREISFCSFYNPTGDGVYGPDTAFEEGAPKPRALLVNLSAVWCGPCKVEAESILPEEYETYHPDGFEIVMVLADTTTPGESAGFEQLDAWVDAYEVKYVAAIDPNRDLANQFPGTGSYPVNILVDPRTMEVVQAFAGTPGDEFSTRVEALLAK